MRTVDAHVHLWDLTTDPQPWIDPTAMTVIDRSFRPADLDHMLDACGIDAAVVVQASNSAAETERLLKLSDPRIAGVVGWADLSADLAPQLDALQGGGGNLIGLRHLVHLEPDETWMLGDAVGRAFDVLADADLPFDLVLRPWQLSLAALIADRHPRTRFILDHVGGFAECDDDAAWARDLKALARRDNVYAKISGLAALAAEGDRLRWALGVALDAFGSTRLMYGSDWPLAELGEGATAWHETVAAAMLDGTPADSANIFSGTATHAYGLSE